EKRNKGLSLFQKALEDRFHQEAEGNAEKELVQFVLDISFKITHPGRLQQEQHLLLHLKDLFSFFSHLKIEERRLVFFVLQVILQGMGKDLRRFPGYDSHSLTAIETWEDLDQYCYEVAGVVGEFWTQLHGLYYPDLLKSHPQLIKWAKGYGKALQLTNILRDIPEDLNNGRCYLPRKELEKVGLLPSDLLHPLKAAQTAPLLIRLLQKTAFHYLEGICYLDHLPKKPWSFRFATSLPLLIGLRTLRLLADSPHLVLIKGTKISRNEVYRLMDQSFYVSVTGRDIHPFSMALFRKAVEKLEIHFF
ncbi:MAG: hypothetical protein D6785_11490, partial [Planctomycetota bacterium]